MTIRIVDLETTGEAPPEHAVVEIGSCDLEEESGQLLAPQAKLVCPNRTMPSDARAVHHISADDVRNAKQLSEVVPSVLTQYPYPKLTAFAAHNAKFEMQWLTPFTGEVPWICSYKVALRLWPNAPNHKNQTLRYELGIEVRQTIDQRPHRAEHDAAVTGYILQVALAKGTSVAQMIAWSKEPPLLPRCPIGEWRNKPWKDVDKGFLKWMLSKQDMDYDLRWNAQQELDKREPPQVRVLIPNSNEAIETASESPDLAAHYVRLAIEALPLVRSRADLSTWWNDPICVEHRQRYGVVEGSSAYADLLKACGARKAELVASSDKAASA